MKRRSRNRYSKVKANDIERIKYMLFDKKEGEALNYAVDVGLTPWEWRYVLATIMRSADDVAEMLTGLRRMAKKDRKGART